MNFPRKVIVKYLGRLGYQDSLTFQQSVEKALKLSKEHKIEPAYQGVLLLVEHNPVYTVGVRSKGYDENLERKLLALNAEFYKTNRGGLITFHGPGQLVAYPILYLKHFDLNVRGYVSSLESMVIKLCDHYGIKAYTSPHTGVWVNDRKICAIGVRISQYVTSHGIALNCNTDLSWFSHIVPCGIENKGVTSLSEELGKDISIQEVIPLLIKYFKETFKTDCDFEALDHKR